DNYSNNDLANILNALDQAYRHASNPSSGGSDIVIACRNAFGSGSSGQQCAAQARNADAVYACRNEFGSGSSGLNCAINAIDAAIVRACRYAFGSGSDGMD